MIENRSPELAARIDALQLAIVTMLKMRPSAAFEACFAENIETWKGSLIATPVPDAYLEQLDQQAEGLLNLLR